MKKTIIIICVVIGVLVGCFYALNAYIYNEKQGDGEAQQSNEILETGSWTWLHTELPNGKMTQVPKDKFVLTLANGSVTSTTDCNQMSGKYIKNGEVLSFTPFASTKMYCEGSIEGEYAQQLGLTTSYVISDTELRLILNRDVGIMVFERTN